MSVPDRLDLLRMREKLTTVLAGTAWLADKTQQRGLIITMLSLVAGAGYIMLAVGKSTGVRYAGTFLAASGVFPAIANILPWVTNNQGNDDRRGVAFVMLNVIGQVGPILGTRLYPTGDAPYCEYWRRLIRNKTRLADC